MATGYQGTEPSSKFCEIIRIGRRQNGRRVEPPVVTIYYKYKSGREGEFEVQGGVLFEEGRNGRQRRLMIVTANGQKLGIARNPGGEYGFTGNYENSFWGVKERVDF
ncbi:unnamed protein product [Porites lobata]|uniref:Jacalin-type lectin domain-containing protein n=1 Tax=Porites lobata TaxID=104759 RepID=A0ABN8QBQ1_9CNID|nr:unnamed protein product [Porites lobata]